MKPTPLQIETIPVPIPSLPDALEDTRLALFADLHMNGRSIAPQHRQALEHVARERPDVICILGDVIDNNTVHVPALAPYLRDVASVAPTVAVLGNNDCFGPKTWKSCAKPMTAAASRCWKTKRARCRLAARPWKSPGWKIRRSPQRACAGNGPTGIPLPACPFPKPSRPARKRLPSPL